MSEQDIPVNDAVAAEAPAEAEEGTTHGSTEPELEQVKLQAQQYLEGWQRERAEFANYKRRIEQQQKDSYQNATGDVLRKVLPIIDDFDRAVSNIPAELDGNPWVGGTAMILRKLNKMLDEFGVSVIDPLGEPFDPSRHEAVTSEDSDAESGTVLEVLQKGYIVGDRVLRPALVKVAR